MKTLLLTIGLPRSGKSTWAIEKGYPIVNRDSIRFAIGGSIRYFEEEERVSEIEKIMVISLFKAGHDHVIIDATHLKEKYRQEWEQKIPYFPCIKIEYVRFNTSLEECIERAIKSCPEEKDFPSIIREMWNNAEIDFKIPERKL